MDRSEVSERLTGVLVSELGLDESREPVATSVVPPQPGDTVWKLPEPAARISRSKLPVRPR